LNFESIGPSASAYVKNGKKSLFFSFMTLPLTSVPFEKSEKEISVAGHFSDEISRKVS
jgi:hypothetical protein